MSEPEAWLAGPEAWLAGPRAWLAGPQVWLAGPQAWLAGPQVWLDGPEGGKGRTENLPMKPKEKVEQGKGTADHLIPLGYLLVLGFIGKVGWDGVTWIKQVRSEQRCVQ